MDARSGLFPNSYKRNWRQHETKERYEKRAQQNRIHKRQVTFFGHLMRKQKLEHFETTGMIEGKGIKGKQREKMLDFLTKCLKVGRKSDALR